MGNRRSKAIETVRSEIRRFNWDFVHEYSNFNTTTFTSKKTQIGIICAIELNRPTSTLT